LRPYGFAGAGAGAGAAGAAGFAPAGAAWFGSPPVGIDGKCRSQRLVAANDLVQGAFEYGRVKRHLQPQRRGNVVEVVAWCELVQEPQALLCI